MKIGVSSYSFSAHMDLTGEGYCQIADRAKEMGYEGIEFTDLSTDVEKAPDVLTLAARVRAHCAELGLPIIAYTVSADFSQDDPAEEARRLTGKVDEAKALGAPLMRHDISRKETNGWRAVVREAAPYVRRVTEYAQAKGIRTCTENHGLYMQDSNRVEELILAVNHENFGWLVDMGNFACADEDSLHALAIAAPYAFHAHAKDFLIKRGAESPGEGWFRSRGGNFLRGTIAGHGDIPIAGCVRLLREAGYDGWLSYEFEGPEQPLPALRSALAYLKRLI